ncbi:MAG TPA: hypothetical protein VLX92_28720 [Kofleriaceae bacterium]|nr:hypothetical protein [Kofleriaceae bacterium]
MRFALLVLVAGCAIPAAPLPAGHPADPRAPIGRLAGPPDALRAGAPADATPPHSEMPAMHHHHP